MPWARLDDRINMDAKVLALSDAAHRMWTSGLAYIAFNLTDGFIPEHAIHTFGVRAANKAKVADEICGIQVAGKAPLWDRVDGGFRVHDYLQWNDSREQVEVAKLTAKQRMALFQNPELRAQIRARDGDRCRYCGRIVRWNDRKGDLGGTYDHVQPYAGNALANLVVCCRSCNSRKRGRTPEEAEMALLDLQRDKPKLVSRFDLDISRSEFEIEVCCQQAQQQASITTYQEEHVQQERETAPSQPVENDRIDRLNERIRQHRRKRSRETESGHPAVKVIAALARDVLRTHPKETDDAELRELLKAACARANLKHDGRSVGDALEQAKAQRRRSS